MKNVKSKIYWIIIVFIFTGYVFFFISPFLFFTEIKLKFTEMNTTMELTNNLTETLKKWYYSPSENKMIVMLTSDYSGLDNYYLNSGAFYTKDGSKEDHSLDVKLSIPFPNIVIATIENVPENFDTVKLGLQVAKDEESVDEEGNITKTKPNTIAYFYTNYKQVERVESLNKYEGDDYRIEYLNIVIEDKNEENKELQEKIQKLEEKNIEYEKSIKDLLYNQQYETTEEVSATNSKIEDYRRAIANNNTDIDTNKRKIEENKTSISEMKTAIERLQEKKKEG